MIEIDGGEQSGSGTIVRFAVALAALAGEPLHLVHARARRATPGLRPQHVAAVRAAVELCRGQAEGLEVGSQELWFEPGPGVRGGSYAWDIGTAGSATMLALGILPLACFADAPCTARIRGGVFQDFAPSPFHLAHVLGRLVGRMGAGVELRVVRAGYLPRGAGEIELRVEPVQGTLRALRLPEPGAVRGARGVAFSSHLEPRRVSERMAQACEARLAAAGLPCTIERALDVEALHAGAGLAVWAETSTGCILGADRAGAPRRSSEAIGRFVAACLLDDLATGATVDRHAADQLVPFAALAAGTSAWVVPRPSEHLASHLWLAERFGARARERSGRVEVEGIARSASPARGAR